MCYSSNTIVDSTKKFSEIINMLEFLIDNIFDLFFLGSPSMKSASYE
jgi:hypothetical protein